MWQAFESSTGSGPIHVPSMLCPLQPKQTKAIEPAERPWRHNRNMNQKIPVAHDFICPWCWVGFLQAKRLEEELEVSFEWLGYELFPEELEWPDRAPSLETPANKPPVLSRFDFLLVADDVELPNAIRPSKMRTFNAHAAVEYAKTEGVADEMISALYHAYWHHGANINEPSVLRDLAKGIVRDLDALLQSIESKQFKANIVGFDEEAYAKGVYNVPTFFIGNQRYAEQPYVNLRKAILHATEN